MDRSEKNFIWDNLLSMSAYWISSGAIISSLSKYWGFSLATSNLIVGLTSTLPIVQLIGGLAFGRAEHPFRFLRLSNGLWRLFLPLVFFSVLLPYWAGAPLMIISYILSIGIFQFAAPSQTSWMISCVEGRSANFYSMRELTFMAAYSVLFCLVSFVIDFSERSHQQRSGFLLIGSLLTILLIWSLIVLFRLPPPPSVQTSKSPMLASLLKPFRSPVFRKAILTNTSWTFSSMFIGGFAAVYQVQVLEMTFFQIMIWTTVANIARTLCIPLMAQLAKHIGWRRVSAFCLSLMAGCAGLWFFATRDNAVYLYPFLSVLLAIPFAGLGVGFLKMQIATTPEDTRSVYISVLALLNGAAALFGSLICSTFIQVLEAYSLSLLRWIFCIGLVGTLISALLILRVPFDDH